jgi:hypothetical protein
MDLRDIGWKHVDWMHLTQDRDQRWALANMVMKGGEFLDYVSDLTSQEGLCSMEFVSRVCDCMERKDSLYLYYQV